MTTAPARPTVLTPAEHRVAAQLVHGGSRKAIARRMFLSPEGVASHLTAIRKKMNCPGATAAVLVHALLTTGEVSPPDIHRPTPDFTDAERKALHAVAEHSRVGDISKAIGVPPRDVKAEIDALIAKADARNAAHLVGLGHAWAVLSGATPRRQAEATLPTSTARV